MHEPQRRYDVQQWLKVAAEFFPTCYRSRGDGLSHLRKASCSHAPLRAIEVQAALIPGQSDIGKEAARLIFKVRY
jgi:hypothetical protein